MGFTREFAQHKEFSEKSQRILSGSEREFKIISVDHSTKRNILYGNHNSKDTKVVTNNVTVFFVLKQMHNGAEDELQNKT